MAAVKDITSLLHSPTPTDIELIEKAYAFSEKAHQGHKRNSGEPYFNHVCETAKTLAELGMGSRTIAAGLLHDTLEDAGVSANDIEKEFGKEVLYLVQGVTKLGTLKYRGLKKHTESLRKLFVATSQDIRVVIIKLADRLHNMRTLQFVPEHKRERIATETLEVYAPIANRLGIGKLKGELEDLAFPYVYPTEYEEVTKLLKQKSKETMPHLEKVTKSLLKELAKHGLANISFDYRIKHLYSLFQKLARKDWDIEKIHDISALRIIVPTVNDCYRVLGIIHSNWRPLPGKIKDYIAFPKPNGYRSLHTTIFTGDGGIVEIQIRTKEMHDEAEYGIASHFSYKETGSSERKNTNLLWLRELLPPIPTFRMPWSAEEKAEGKGLRAERTDTSTPQWIKHIAEAHQTLSESEDFMTNLKTDFFSHRVFVFTPKGDVVDLPTDSSPIDFAYAIHSDVGDHLGGAKVNGKMVSLDTPLKNGDIVEIMTKKTSRPTPKWLEFAKTTLAKRHIRAALQKLDAE